jgi:hypothetical protein
LPVPLRSLSPRRWTAGLLPALLVLLLAACAEEPLPKQRLGRDDCLVQVKLKELKEALQRCDAVVAAFPRDPGPLNDRFLLHTLSGDGEAACRDIKLADALARKQPAGELDPLLVEELKLRVASCRD